MTKLHEFLECSNCRDVGVNMKIQYANSRKLLEWNTIFKPTRLELQIKHESRRKK